MQVVTTPSVMEIFINNILQKLKASLTGAKGTLTTFEVDVREEGSVNPLFRYIGEKFGGELPYPEPEVLLNATISATVFKTLKAIHGLFTSFSVQNEEQTSSLLP